MRRLLACLLLALSLPAIAEIFSYVDANGNTVFTNEPPPGSNAQSVSLPPVNSMAAPPNSPSAEPQNDSSAADQSPNSNPNSQPTRQTVIDPNDDDDQSYDNDFNTDQPARDILNEPRALHPGLHRR
jgi:hypothetical protein